MRRLGENRLVRIVMDTAGLYFSKNVPRAAAELTYFLILSFFPLLICVNALIASLRLDVAQLLRGASIIIPEQAAAVLTEYVRYITENQSPALVVAGVGMMLFSASAAMRSVIVIIGEIHGRPVFRGFWQIVASVVFSLLLLVSIYLSLVVVLTGSWFFHMLEDVLSSLPHYAEVPAIPWQWQWLRFWVLFLTLMFFIVILYQATLPRSKPRPPILLGAFLASVALVGFSGLFSWFIGLSSRYSLVYGSLGSVIILLVWLYLCGTIVLIGSCFNQARSLHPRKRKDSGAS